MTDSKTEYIYPKRRKLIILIVPIIIAIIAISLFTVINSYARNKPNKFLLPRESELQIKYDPVRIVKRDLLNEGMPKRKVVPENNYEVEFNLI